MDRLARLRSPGGSYLLEQRRGNGSSYLARRRDETSGGPERRCLLTLATLEPPLARAELLDFAAEARALLGADRPGFAPFLDAFAFDETGPRDLTQLADLLLDRPVTLGIAQLWPEGRSLRDLIAGRQRLGARPTELLLGQLLERLAPLHASGMAHGDIRPDNVLLDRHGAAWLVGGPLPRAISKRAIAPAVEYAPLESLMRGPTPAGDVYSLGLSVLFAASGLHPADVLPREDQPIADLSELEKILGRGVTRTLTAMIAPKRSERARDATVARVLLARSGRSQLRRAALPLAAALVAIAIALVAFGAL